MMKFTFDCPDHGEEIIEIESMQILKIALCEKGIKQLAQTGYRVSIVSDSQVIWGLKQ